MGEGNRLESTDEALWAARGSCGRGSVSCLARCFVHHWCRDQRGWRSRADLRQLSIRASLKSATPNIYLGRKAAGFRLDTGDVRSFDGFVVEVRKTLQSWGRDRFDYLVNNAGNSLHAGFEKTTEAQFDEIVNEVNRPSGSSGRPDSVMFTLLRSTLRGRTPLQPQHNRLRVGTAASIS
jgi:hypothetical protein